MLELQKEMIDINGERLQAELKLSEVCQQNEELREKIESQAQQLEDYRKEVTTLISQYESSLIYRNE